MQRRAARWACNNYHHATSVTNLIKENLKWDSLKERRAKSKATLVYKARNKMCHIPTEDLIPNNSKVTRRSRDGYMVPRSRTNAHLFSFYPSAIRLWNGLPNEIQSSSTIKSFKDSISKIEVNMDITDTTGSNQNHVPNLSDPYSRGHICAN